MNAEIAALPDAIGWHAGDVMWGLETGKSSLPLNTARLEVFVLPAEPVPKMHKETGVWVELLRYLCEKAGVVGLKRRVDIAAKIAEYCIRHGQAKGLEYDHWYGGSKYGTRRYGGEFQLRNYLLVTKKEVNCYDQAGAVETLLGALGVPARWLYLEPYGFITPAQLVLRRSNNPFFKNKYHRKKGGEGENGWDIADAVVEPDYFEARDVVGADGTSRPLLWRFRSDFANHAFCGVEPEGSGAGGSESATGGSAGTDRIVDACAGPHTGTETREGYVKAAIDTKTKLYAALREYGIFIDPGTAGRIKTFSGITEIE